MNDTTKAQPSASDPKAMLALIVSIITILGAAVGIGQVYGKLDQRVAALEKGGIEVERQRINTLANESAVLGERVIGIRKSMEDSWAAASRGIEATSGRLDGLLQRVAEMEGELRRLGASIEDRRARDSQEQRRAVLQRDLSKLEGYALAAISPEHGRRTNREILLDALNFTSSDAQVEAARKMLEDAVRAAPQVSNDRYYNIDYPGALESRFAALKSLIEARMRE